MNKASLLGLIHVTLLHDTLAQTLFESADLHVVSHGDGSVRIQNMESDLCQVQTERGHCVLQSLKVIHLNSENSMLLFYT